MSTTDSQKLLREYVQGHSEDAFEQLVRRYVDLVYSVAVRRVNGANSLAEDVAQQVFTDFARKAASLPDDVMLGGWLHHHTCYVAASTMRKEQRRLEREKQALEMNALNASTDSDWNQLAPILDEAIDNLEPADRNAIVLRFFERLDLKSVGAILGSSEDAAQKRVCRALEKLRTMFLSRGLTLSIAALAAMLSARAVEAAPASLAQRMARAAEPAAAAGGLMAAVMLKTMPTTAAKLVWCGLALALAVAAFSSYHKISNRAAMTAADARGGAQASSKEADGHADLQSESAPAASEAVPASTNALHLVIVAADSGRPVPIVQIEYRGWEGDKFSGKTFTATRFGICDMEIPRATITQLELTTRIDGFADTRLHWERGQVKNIPFTYTLRLARAVPIGGRVIDPDGQPVAGAKVGFNHNDSPASLGAPEDHHFVWIQVPTDTNGNWRIERIAPEMLRLIYGSASHPDYVESAMIDLTQDREAERKLKEGTFSFQLGRAVTVHGLVVDPDGAPLAGASVLVGKRAMSDSRSTKTGPDGTFSVNGCRPGKSVLSAEADGFSTTSMEVELNADSQPFRLTLQRGNILLLRLVSQSGEPVPKAYVWLDTMNQVPHNDPNYGKTVVQADFERRSDAQGRITWSNAPDTELSFDIGARGFMRTNAVKVLPDGQEHLIVLPPAVTVSGTVRDAASGQPIPSFKIVTGWPVTNFVDHTVRGQWSPFERDWLSFSDGLFRHVFEEPLIYGGANPGYMLRFQAEGYASFTSRPIRADEAEVRLDVVLHASAETSVSVLLPDNRPATQADVGFVTPHAGLQLVPGGLSHQNFVDGTSLLATDDKGTFRLPSDESISRIIVAHPAGFAEVSAAALAADPTIHLQPWGRLEGTYTVAGQPATNRDLLFQFGKSHSMDLSASFDAYRVKTDQSGRFVFDRVPPGNHEIIRLIPVGGGTLQHDPLADVEIRSGETTTTTIGGDGYSVAGRLLWPDDWKQGSNQRVYAFIQSAPPQAMAALANSSSIDPAAAAQVQLSPEVQQYIRNSRHFQAAVAGDFQSLSAEEVPAGDYILIVSVMTEAVAGQTGNAPRIGAKASFTVPSDPPSGSLDLGEISLR